MLHGSISRHHLGIVVQMLDLVAGKQEDEAYADATSA
jgi:hypothetical protein